MNLNVNKRISYCLEYGNLHGIRYLGKRFKLRKRFVSTFYFFSMVYFVIFTEKEIFYFHFQTFVVNYITLLNYWYDLPF